MLFLIRCCLRMERLGKGMLGLNEGIIFVFLHPKGPYHPFFGYFDIWWHAEQISFERKVRFGT